MADTKISALTALTGANVDTAADVLAIVDTSATATKKILVDELRNAIGPVLGTEQATTSGTAINFTSIPSWVKRVTINFVGVSTNGTDNVIVQIGDSGGIEASGYTGSLARLETGLPATVFSMSTGFVFYSNGDASQAVSGRVILELEDSSDNTWTATGSVSNGNSVHVLAGSKALSATLDRLRIQALSGVNTFDAGAVNILYE